MKTLWMWWWVLITIFYFSFISLNFQVGFLFLITPPTTILIIMWIITFNRFTSNSYYIEHDIGSISVLILIHFWTVIGVPNCTPSLWCMCTKAAIRLLLLCSLRTPFGMLDQWKCSSSNITHLSRLGSSMIRWSKFQKAIGCAADAGVGVWSNICKH